jgi:thiamine-phosphate diphosphorylase
MVQVRAHSLDNAALATLSQKVVAEAGDAIVVVNGPIRAAVESGSHGVHLRERSEPVSQEAAPSLLQGRSVHSIAAAQLAEGEGANYIVLGTIFPSMSHPGGETGGTELATAVTREVDLPVIGIGGITAENASSVTSAGAAGVAVIGAIIDATSPFEAAKQLSTAIEVR